MIIFGKVSENIIVFLNNCTFCEFLLFLIDSTDAFELLAFSIKIQKYTTKTSSFLKKVAKIFGL